ncbi:MAG: hypothetical protein KDJ16_17735 [Hyphomicrobiales bacterium]|nr:hypothetical protein [Hyphomicrobiales bacterium]
MAPILPVSAVWILHIFAGTSVVALAVAYPLYLRAAGLGRRISLDRARVASLFAAGPARWAAINVLLYWALFVGLMAQIVTGVAMYRGYGGLIAQVHLFLTWAIIFYAVAHVAAHFAFGGATQLLRVVRPAPIPVAAPASGLATPWASRRSGRGAAILALSIGAGLLAGYVFLHVDRSERDVLHVRRISTKAMRDLRSDLSDPAWRMAPLVVHTNQGENFDGTGATAVEIRAVRDDTYICMALSWDDPTRSLKHAPLVKRADGWHALFSAPDAHHGVVQANSSIYASDQRPASENAIAEDKFAVMLTDVEKPYGPGAFHPGPRPLAGKPPSASGRGMHYTLDGSFMSLWLWHADGEKSRRCENVRVGGAPKPTADQMRGLEPYKGGIVAAADEATVIENFAPSLPRDIDSVVRPKRLPTRYVTPSPLASADLNPDNGDDPGVRWHMSEEESEPYSAAADARFPVGAMIPGLIGPGPRPASAQDVYCSANWAAGRWMLLVKRRLDTGSRGDIAISNRTHIWVAAFDHTVADHTRHVRPVRLELEE